MYADTLISLAILPFLIFNIVKTRKQRYCLKTAIQLYSCYTIVQLLLNPKSKGSHCSDLL